MKVLRTIREVRAESDGDIALVPTMGALHEGHLSLVRYAAGIYGRVVVSIFVNPTQFGPEEDYSKYPRPEDRDLELAKSAGATIAFLPSVDEMYANAATRIDIGSIGDMWEGASRPGHFSGVATVVAKLFHIVVPSLAVFGEKDFQQCVVVRQLVRDLNFDIALHFHPTIREPDGLAMSSRNAYLSPSERVRAPLIHSTLQCLRDDIAANAAIPKMVATELARHRTRLAEAGFDVDYLELVDETTLVPVRSFDSPARLIVAAKLGDTRLIDNISVSA